MKKKGKDLEFISFIKRDGSGTIPIPSPWNEKSDYPKTDDMSYQNDDNFNIYRLSISEKTFIAIGFNSFVVKLKKK